MKEVSFSSVFKGNFLSYVTKYKENIQNVLSKYEYAIVMARKAICFFEAMYINGEISETGCKVFSSRVIDYNILNELRGKEVVLIDDVVVKGTSLKHVIELFSKYEIKAYVLVVACEESFPKTIKSNSNFIMCNSYVTLEQGDIYSFAGQITEYIEASMYPFNVDQPIYTINDINQDRLNRMLIKYNAVNISSGVQQNYGISNNVIYFSTAAIADIFPAFKDIPVDSVMKIRIMSSKRIMVIPFVLFPELTIEELESLYSIVSNNCMDKLANVDNALVSYENKMKFISYYFSELLAEVFFCAENINGIKNIRNDIHQFSKCTEEIFTQRNSKPEIECGKLYQTSIRINYSKFFFPNIVSACYDVINKSVTNCAFYDSKENLINDYVITLEQFEKSINKYSNDAKFLASCVIDVFIDRGMMVPAIVHSKHGIIRAYKMGEYSKLTKTELDSFVAMLYEYQENIKAELGKTEFEKLCVLYFNDAIAKDVFTQQAKYEDDCYSICYSLFGPRVTASKVSYTADYNSTLITNFCSNDNKYVIYSGGKYTILPASINNSSRLSMFKTGFAYKYSRIRQLYDSEHPANNYVHTYTQYLTLRAIGNNKKNQYLSICAELYQITKLNISFFSQSEEEISANYGNILSGINSGLWKYWCFKNDALNTTTFDLFNKNKDAGAILLLDAEPPSDKSERWDTSIDNAAYLLFNVAFLIDAVFREKKFKNKFSSLNSIFRDEKGAFGKKQEISDCLNQLQQYYKHLFTESGLSREKLEKEASSRFLTLTIELRRQLELCDNMLENSTAHNSTYKTLLTVFSDKGEFPSIVSVGLKELFFEGISNSVYCRVYGISEGFVDLSGIIEENSSIIKENDLKLIMLDGGQLQKIQSVSDKVKDSQKAKVINSIIDNFKKVLHMPNCDCEPKQYPMSYNNSLVLTPISDDGLSISQISKIMEAFAGRCSLATFNITVNQNVINANGTLEVGTIDSIGTATFIESSGENNIINIKQ